MKLCSVYFSAVETTRKLEIKEPNKCEYTFLVPHCELSLNYITSLQHVPDDWYEWLADSFSLQLLRKGKSSTNLILNLFAAFISV